MPYQVVRNFESRVAAYAGARYGVAVESGSAAIFLSLMYAKQKMKEADDSRWNNLVVDVPSRTYPSVPCSVIHAGWKVRFIQDPWEGIYQLNPLLIHDGALRFRRGMYAGGLHCLSFHVKKHLAIGRGGMILLNDPKGYEWLKRARFDGRKECDLDQDDLSMLGWNMYMTPDQAARGLMAFSIINNRKEDPADLDAAAQGYPDLSKYEVYKR